MTAETKIAAGASIEQLPNDANTLKQMALTLPGQIDDLNGQLYYLKRQLFGKKSEKLDPAQRLLFESLYDQVKSKIDQQKPPKAKTAKKRRNANHKGRNPLPKDLPREVIEIEPPEEEKTCPVCNNEKRRIGSEETEKLEYVPASFYVKKYVRYKYACKECESHISIGQLPPMAIDKGIPGEGLLAHIITSKYCDHNPLNRLEGILKRHGVDINVSTMCDWVGKSSDLLAPLVKRMHEKILQSPKINTDDTPIPVKSKNRRGSTYKGYLWVYVDDPILDIDNNLSERILRMVVIGRKNYMFAGSEAGAWRAAIIYSLVANCKLNKIDPFRYFRDVLARVSTHPAAKIDEILPGEWKKLNAEADADLGDDDTKIVRVA